MYDAGRDEMVTCALHDGYSTTARPSASQISGWVGGREVSARAFNPSALALALALALAR